MASVDVELPRLSYPLTRVGFDPSSQVRGPQIDAVTRVRLPDDSEAWMVTGYTEARAVFADGRFSADPHTAGYPLSMTIMGKALELAQPVLPFMDDPTHAALRRLVTPDFMVKRVETLRPRIQNIVDRQIDQMIEQGSPVDLVRTFAHPVPALAICELLGVPYADHDFFQKNSLMLLNVDTAEQNRRAATEHLTAYFAELAAAKQKHPGDDLTSRLATTHVRDGSMTLQDVATMSMALLIAGHETTGNMIALGTLALLRHPEQLAVVRDSDDPAITRGAVEELLRYLTIAGVRTRVACEDVQIGAVTIKAGDGVVIPIHEANRTVDIFSGNPDQLDIHRNARHHLAFGYGIHQCLGQPLARVELQVAFPTLLRRLPNLALHIPFEEVPFRINMTNYGVYQLPVTW